MRFEFKKAFGRKSVAVILSVLLLLGIASCFFAKDIRESVLTNDYMEKYPTDLEHLIKTAERNKNNLAKDSYLYKYQDEIIEKYSAMLDTQAPSAVSGYDNYILFGNKSIFLLIAAAVFGSVLMLTEQDSKMTALHAISKRGKRVYRNKAAAACLLAVVGSFLFSAAQLTVFLSRFGADGLSAPLVSIQEFELCPYGLTVFEYLLIQTGALSLLTCTVTQASCLAGRFFGSYVIAVFAGLIPAGVYFFGENTFRSLFVRYRALNIGGHPVFLGNVVVAAMLLIVAVLIAVMCFAPVHRSTSAVVGIVERKAISIVSSIPGSISMRLSKLTVRKRKKLFFYELKKISSASLLIVILLIGSKCCFDLQPQKANNLYDDLYFDICTELSGELTEKKETYIRNALASAKETVSKHDCMRKQMMTEKISREEYEAYLESYYQAEIDAYIFTRLEAKADYILELREAGKEAYIVYETGWNRLLFAQYDLFLYLAVTILLSGMFGVEQKSGMEQTLKIARYGTKRLTAIKVICALSLTAVLFVLFEAIDLISVMMRFPLPNGNYPAIGLSCVSPNVETSLSTYLIFNLARKMFGYLVLGGIICFVSRLLKKVYFVIPVVLAITLLPHYLIDNIPVWLDFLNLIS